MRLLLLSNSTNAGEAYLSYSKKDIKRFLGDNVLNILFIPYAAVTFSYDDYEQKVNGALEEVNIQVKSIHHYSDAYEAVIAADAIMIGGGNTWKLLKTLREQNLLDLIKEKTIKGMPYVGWSAGSNVACPTIKTTNDMPIVDPKGFEALDLVKFQINPHYLDVSPANHGGETREMRIEEFLQENQTAYVVGLREGTMLELENQNLKLIGDRNARIFKYGKEPRELNNSSDFSFLVNG